MKIIIRAGGQGTRLWPLSRANSPKQFQSLVGDKSMIRTTYERVLPILKSPNDLFISVNENFRTKAQKEIPELREENFILETDTRNTGPAMCLEVCWLEKNGGQNEVIASLPSDDYISDSRAFRDLLLVSEEFLLKHPDYILTPAIKPDYPDTGYTYFKAGKNLQKKGEEAIFEVAQVVEKPNQDYCEELLESGIFYCHTGMYLWPLRHIVNLFKKWQPAMYEICTQVVASLSKDKERGRELYSQLEKITIETAITEKADKLAMSVSNSIGWSDLGKWHVIKRILAAGERENFVKGQVLAREASNNMIYSSNNKKLIVVNDISDLVIVDTDDALFVSSLKNSQDVKLIVEKLKEGGKSEYL